jgi:hypothetical protein
MKKTLTRHVFKHPMGMMMPEVVLTRVEFIPSRDLDELEKKVTDLLKDFEKRHKGIDTYAEIEIIKRE